MKNRGKLNLGALVGFIALCVSPLVLAWDGFPDGRAGSDRSRTRDGNRGFSSVIFRPNVPMCGNSNVWAYLNTIGHQLLDQCGGSS